MIRQLVELGVVDELDVVSLPVIVGTGTRLLQGDEHSRAGLELQGSRALTSGAVHMVYATERAGAGG